jgi:hypothetical protein
MASREHGNAWGLGPVASRTAALAVLALFSLPPMAQAEPPRRLFDVTLERVEDTDLLSVGFYPPLPAPDVVDSIVRQQLELAVTLDPSHDILAVGLAGDDAMNEVQYSGSLIYVARQKKIQTFEKSRGLKTELESSGDYVTEIKEDKTYEGITPERRWLDVTIVFAKAPSIDRAYKAISIEAEKLSTRGLDVSLHVSVGDPKVRTSWRQIKDADGAYIFARYEAATKELTRKDKLLSRIN